MKIRILAMLPFCFAAVNGIAEDITTRSGQIYQNIKITRVEPDGLSITHAAGIVKIPFTDLPDDLQEKHQYHPEKAAQYREQARKRHLEYERRAGEARQKNLQEQQSRLKNLEGRTKQAEHERQMDRQAKHFRVEIIRMENGGAIARPYDRIKTDTFRKHGNAGGMAKGYNQYGEFIFIEGLPERAARDGKWEGYLSSAGTYTYQESHMPHSIPKYRVAK
jgi:hypothetical protein